MLWILLGLIILIGGLVLLVFIIITEGRFFGKRLLRWIYNLRTGEFETRDDWDLWHHFIQRLEIGPEEQLLDLGTATGHLPRLVARQPGFRGRAVGVDWSEEMIQEAQRQARLEGTAAHTQFVCADVQKPLPFPDDTFTLVACVTGLLEGLRHPETLFQEIRRILQPNGRLVLSYAPHPLRPTSIRHTSWFSEQLTKLGFSKPRFIPWTASHKLVLAYLKGNPKDTPT